LPSIKTIDVAIGIAFLYLLLTFVASAIVEMISAASNWRGQMLYRAISNMLEGSELLNVGQVYANPLLRALCRRELSDSLFDFVDKVGWRAGGEIVPSYIPAAVFSAAIIDELIEEAEPPCDLTPEGAIASVRTLVMKDSSSHRNGDALRSLLEVTLATQGASIQAVRFAIEKWFNDSMDRTSGWYKRRTQSCLLLIGILIGFGFNVDTIGIGRWLWQGDAVRQMIVAKASDYVRDKTLLAPPGRSAGSDLNSPPTGINNFVGEIVNLDRQISTLQYPIGWPPPSGRGFKWFLQYFLGSTITAIALSMGSTVWFDAVQSLLKIRSSGPKPAAR
jgi:hypothetical protein